MTSERDNQLVAFTRPPLGAEGEAMPDGGAGSLWSIVDDRLRGRWRIAIAAGLALGVLFAVLGYLSTAPKFASGGLIRVAPNIYPVLSATPETGMVPLYHNFVQTQVQLIGSQAVLRRALEDEALSEQPWARQPDALGLLRSSLTVEADRRSELITVQVVAESADFAYAAANAVINAYDEIYASVGGDDIGRKLRTLRDLKTPLRLQRIEIEGNIRRIVGNPDYAAGDLRELLRAKAVRLETVELDIEELEQTLAVRGASPEQPVAGAFDDAGGATAMQLDLFDPRLAELRRYRDAVHHQFERIKSIYRPLHREYIDAEKELRLAEERLLEREIEVEAEWLAAKAHGTLDSASTGLMTPGQLETRLERLTLKADSLRQELRRISADNQTLESWRAELDELKRDSDEIDARIRHLDIEKDTVRTGRISIAARGDRPEKPWRDRRPELAAVGFVAGVGLSFGFFFFIGTINRRAYGAAQLRDGRGPRCLGVLPDLRRSRSDPESSLVAAHCMHQIRNHIETTRAQKRGFVLAVSSPYQGDGKTSIVMALGWSYAAAGHRTLLVDCDLVGQTMTHHLEMHDRPGLKEAIRESRANGQVVSTDPGGDRVDQSFTQRLGDGNQDLSVLPVGLDPGIGAEVIRKQELDAVFEQLRRKFDMIIVDTGPMMGSLEGLPVATAADGVLLSIRRGRARSRLQDCVELLERAGASCLGIVLNCAVRSDCDRYLTKSSLVPASAEAQIDDSSRPAGAAAAEQNALLGAMHAAAHRSKNSD